MAQALQNNIECTIVTVLIFISAILLFQLYYLGIEIGKKAENSKSGKDVVWAFFA